MMRKVLVRSSLLCLLIAATLGCGGPTLQPVLDEPGPVMTPRPDGTVDLFFNDLSPYGEWVWLSGPGWVWYPYNVSVGWRPYRYGHWVYSDYGWTWVSDEDWGWAVYHYGRWHYEASYGWVWVPGTEWGPAWVAWHAGRGWVGWAPLPWEVHWHAEAGLDWGGIDLNITIDPTWWSFSRTRYLADPDLKKYIAPAARNVTLIQNTKNVTHYTLVDNRIVNQSVNVTVVEKATGKPVRRVRVRHADAVEAAHGVKFEDSQLVIFRPDLHSGRTPQRRPVPPGHADRQHPGDSRVTTAPPEGRGRSHGQSHSDPPARVRRTVRQDRNLEARHAREREQLERIHTKESQKQTPGPSREKVNRRQDAENRALEKKQDRERKLFEERLKRVKSNEGRGRSSMEAPGDQPTDKERPSKAASSSSRSGPSKIEAPQAKSESGKSKSHKADSKKSKAGKSKSKRSKSGKSKADKKDSESDDEEEEEEESE
jgi:hypothetical protein